MLGNKHIRRQVFLATVVIAAGLCLFSYYDTVKSGEFYWPPTELSLRTIDTDGVPVGEAILQVYQHEVAAPQFQAAFLRPKILKTSKVGNLKILLRPLRWQYNGWQLFWLVPIGTFPPDFSLRVEAAGFQPLITPFQSLVDDRRFVGKRTIERAEEQPAGISSDGELAIFECDLILQRE